MKTMIMKLNRFNNLSPYQSDKKMYHVLNVQEDRKISVHHLKSSIILIMKLLLFP